MLLRFCWSWIRAGAGGARKTFNSWSSSSLENPNWLHCWGAFWIARDHWGLCISIYVLFDTDVLFTLIYWSVRRNLHRSCKRSEGGNRGKKILQAYQFLLSIWVLDVWNASFFVFQIDTEFIEVVAFRYEDRFLFPRIFWVNGQLYLNEFLHVTQNTTYICRNTVGCRTINGDM